MSEIKLLAKLAVDTLNTNSLSTLSKPITAEHLSLRDKPRVFDGFNPTITPGSLGVQAYKPDSKWKPSDWFNEKTLGRPASNGLDFRARDFSTNYEPSAAAKVDYLNLPNTFAHAHADYLHGDGPRTAARNAVNSQHPLISADTTGARNVAYYNNPKGYELVEQRFSPETISKYLVTDTGNFKTDFPSVDEPLAAPGSFAFVPKNNESGFNSFATRPSIMNHELEHAAQQPYKLDTSSVPVTIPGFMSQTAEIGPSIGDLAFMAAEYKANTGKPLQHVVELTPPEYRKHSINPMRMNINDIEQKAREHGYFNGRSMSDLIFNTPEGQSWYRDWLSRSMSPDQIEALDTNNPQSDAQKQRQIMEQIQRKMMAKP
jgi:hypothetical protein